MKYNLYCGCTLTLIVLILTQLNPRRRSSVGTCAFFYHFFYKPWFFFKLCDVYNVIVVYIKNDLSLGHWLLDMTRLIWRHTRWQWPPFHEDSSASQPFIHQTIYPFIYSSIHPFTHLSIHLYSPIHTFTHSSIYPFIQSPIHSSAHDIFHISL